eukprot:Rhum_TRINITY_DN14614_c7_g1::Rhum_TRINITY_DN14614_c7_g1_i7::g.104293::m.104293
MVHRSWTSRAPVPVLLLLCALTPADGLLREAGRWFRNAGGTDESSAGNDLQVGRYSTQANAVSGLVYSHQTGACATPITGDDIFLDKPFVFTMFYLGQVSPWNGNWANVAFVQWKTATGDMLVIKTSGSGQLAIYQEDKAGAKPWTFDLDKSGPGFHFLIVSVREVGNELRVFVNNDGEVKGPAAGTTFQPMAGATEFRIGCEGAGTWTASVAMFYDVRYWVGDLGQSCPGGSATSTFHGGMCYGMDGKSSTYDADKCQKSYPAFPTTHAEVHDRSTDMFLTIYSHSNALKDQDLYIAYEGDRNKRAWPSNPDAWSWATGNPNDYKTMWCGNNLHQRNDWRSIDADDDCQGTPQPNNKNDNCAQYAAEQGPGLLDRSCTRNSGSLCSRDISQATCATFTCPPTKRRLDDVYCNTDGCVEDLCCTDDVLCATAFTCSAGFVAKPAADEVVCKETGTPACDDTTCCNAVCDSFTCPAGAVQKAGKGGKVCGALPTNCNENKCCDAFCSDFTCPAFMAHKASADTTKCTSAADCTSALCCDALCGSYTCDPAALRDKVDKDTIVCGPLATACTDQTCCDALVTCAAFTCPAASLTKNPVPLCGIDPAECNQGKCCDAKVFCDAYTCPAGFESKANPATILCGASAGDCKGKCCNAQVMCNQFTCSTGFQHKPNKGTIACGIAVSDCSDAICCDQDVKCDSFTCTTGTVFKPTPDTILCGITVADCTNTLCCDTTCDLFTCSSTSMKKPGSVICGAAVADCTNAKCCDEKVFCDDPGFTCGVRRQLKPGADALQCGIAVSDCTKKTCCDFVCANFACGTGFQDKPAKDTIVCGPTNADCTKATCCDAQVFCDTFTCQAGKRLKATAPAVSCGLATADCSPGLCCDDLVFCDRHTCGSDFQKLGGAEKIECGLVAAECSNSLCCEKVTSAPPTNAPSFTCSTYTCPQSTEPKTGAANTACGARPGDCTATKCCQNLVLKGSSSEIAQSKESGDAATAAAAVSTSGGRIKALMKMECKVEDVDLDLEKLDWEFHPLTFGLGSHQHKYFLGAVVGNFSLLGVFLILNYLSALMLVHVFGVAWETAVYYARAPGLVYIPLVWLLMGTSMAASNMAFFPSRAPVLVAVAGWLALIACAAMPVGMWFGLLRPSRFHAVPVPDPRVNPNAAALVAELTGEKEEQKLLTGWRKRAYIFVFGSWIWVRKPGASDFYVEEWGLFFETYRKGFHWFSIVEMTQIMFLAFASAWKPHTYTYCVIRNVMITLVLLIFFAVIVYFRPYNSTFDYLVAALMSGLMFFAVLFMTISICLRGEPSDTVSLLTNLAGILLFASALLLAAKGLYDIVLYLTDIIFVGRRKTAQKAAREGDITEWMNGEPADGRRNLDGFTSEGSMELEEVHLVTRGGLQPFESSQTYSRLGEEDRSDHARPLEVYDTKNVLELEESRIVTTPPLGEDLTTPLSQRESPAAQQRSSASVVAPANPLSVHMTRSIYAGRSRTVSDTVVGGSTPKPVRANSEKSMNMSSARARGLRGAAASSNTDLGASYEIKPYITKV